MNVRSIDHLVITATDPDRTTRWYREVLGMRVETFGDGRTALRFGEQKLNLHRVGREIEPHAARPTPGSADVCFLVDGPVDAVADELGAAGVRIELGPVERTAATGPVVSVYVRDPDGNLIELAVVDPPI